jgi:hypothetical protein
MKIRIVDDLLMFDRDAVRYDKRYLSTAEGRKTRWDWIRTRR